MNKKTRQEIYDRYMRSAAWQAKRKERLEIDGYKCAVCGSIVGLDVHHLTYERFENEDALNDLLTACERHHPLLDDIERFHRYGRREHTTSFVPTVSPNRQEANNYGMASSTLSVDFIGPNADAQRADGRPAEQVLTGNQTGFVKANQDRRRL